MAARARAHEEAQEAQGADSGAGPDMGDFLGGFLTPEMMELLKVRNCDHNIFCY